MQPGTGCPKHWNPGKGDTLSHPHGHRERHRLHGLEPLLPLVSVAPAKKPHSQADPDDHPGSPWPWAVGQGSQHLPLHSCTQSSSHSIGGDRTPSRPILSLLPCQHIPAAPHSLPQLLWTHGDNDDERAIYLCRCQPSYRRSQSKQQHLFRHYRELSPLRHSPALQ